MSSNVVTNNGGDGILFRNSFASIASGNTIRGNGDGLRNLIVYTGSQVFGTNVPRAGCFL